MPDQCICEWCDLEIAEPFMGPLHVEVSALQDGNQTSGNEWSTVCVFCFFELKQVADKLIASRKGVKGRWGDALIGGRDG